MAQKTEKISQDIVDIIKKGQDESNEIIFTLGQLSLRLRDVHSELSKLENTKKELEEKIDGVLLRLDNTIGDLYKKYPNGELDLVEGTVTFEE